MVVAMLMNQLGKTLTNATSDNVQQQKFSDGDDVVFSCLVLPTLHPCSQKSKCSFRINVIRFESIFFFCEFLP